jgi:hypothetical protein
MDQKPQKSLDHLVLPVSNLDIARTRLSALGFTVAPDGRHPFGTSNACVFFEDNTYFEPLAINHREVYQREAEQGNSFLRRDKLYRENNGENGFSLIALTSNNASAEREINLALGYDCGPMVSFRRNVVQPDGSDRQISINLFITSTDYSPNLALFSCQWLSDKVFDDALNIHANGVVGISSITILADANSMEYFTDIAGQFQSGTKYIALKNAKLNLMSADEVKQAYDIGTNDNRAGPCAIAVDLVVTDIFYTAVVLRISGIASKQIGKRLVVAPADGQGYTIAFIEQDDSQA